MRLAEFYRVTLSEESLAERDAADAAAAAREAAAGAWMESWRKSGAAAGPPPGAVTLFEVSKVVAKTVVKNEVARFMEGQLLPMVRTQLRENIVPTLLAELRSILWDLCRGRFLGVGLAAALVTSVATATVVGPWVAVYLILQRRRTSG
mmetsp:Transcript_44236/g.73587  ORF Transcript_44236/g.73587 Transcript_44236/m.73587 type:complete len:149 (+) Transcript_44236:3-449(+)